MRVEEFVKADETMPEAVYRFVEEEVLTEESTDLILDLIMGVLGKSKLRFIPFLSGALRKWVDGMLPEKLLEVLRNLMDRKGLLSARRVDPNSPFRR